MATGIPNVAREWNKSNGIRKKKGKETIEREQRNERLKANQEYAIIFILLIPYERSHNITDRL